MSNRRAKLFGSPVSMMRAGYVVLVIRTACGRVPAGSWTVGVTAHHLARAFEAVGGIVTAVASGQSRGNFSTKMLDEMNAQHAKEHANCTKAETIALHNQGVVAAAAVVRGLSDEQLAKSGTVFTDAPPMTAERLVTAGLLNHIDEHIGSIRKTVGL